MAGSATNIYSYEVCVMGKRLMIACNNWSRLIREVDYEGEQWLKAKSIHLVQRDPLWIS